MIEINELSKSYGKAGVLSKVSLTFEKGMVYGIVGENGAGKTTLFRCLAGLESYEGIVRSTLPELKNELGLLLTEPFFFPKITGREYIRLLCNARSVKSDGLDEKNIFDLPLDRYASSYSTGMKKKLALTAILLQENKVFVLDEPFNGVDIRSNMLITDIIRRLRQLGKTVIISSHIFSTLRDTCDIIHVLKDGRISRTVNASEFDSLEAEMKEGTSGARLEQLGLM